MNAAILPSSHGFSQVICQYHTENNTLFLKMGGWEDRGDILRAKRMTISHARKYMFLSSQPPKGKEKGRKYGRLGALACSIKHGRMGGSHGIFVAAVAFRKS